MKKEKFLETIDHPFVFAIALTFVIVPMMALMNWGFTELGWPGPAALFKNP